VTVRRSRKGPFPDALAGFDLDALAERPELAALIARSCAAWSYVEAEMAVLLGVLLGANSDAAIAVYQTLRRATARVSAIKAAAQIVLNSKENELLGAVLHIHQSARQSAMLWRMGASLPPSGCDVIRSEKRSGTSTAGREELRTTLDFIRKGDTLVVTRIDRLARSIGDLQDIVRELRGKGATLKATGQPIDTATAAGKAFLDMLGVFAEFETNLRKESQLEGISAAKARGVYKGRPPSIEAAKVRTLKAQGFGATEIAKRLGVGRASVYRVSREPSA
jgi:DNA invertase Pin-like site-specific DNA recombinase